jgi:hypothetical protein
MRYHCEARGLPYFSPPFTMSQTLQIIETPHFESDPTLNDYLATISAKSAFFHDMINTKIDENN